MEVFQDITPREVGISIKFRLDEDTEKFKNSNEGDVKKTEDSGIVKYFKNLDIKIEKSRKYYTTSIFNEMEKVNNYDDRSKTSSFIPDKSSFTNKGSSINKNDIFNNKMRQKKNKKVE